jgi:hypothetical protein
MSQTFGQLLIVADYYINTGSYAKNCENKNRPQLKCNGKCQMMKKLKGEEKKDQQNPERKITFKNITLSSKSFFGAVHSVGLSLQIFYPFLNTAVLIDRTTDIFHPPQAGKGNLYCL